MYFTRYKLHFLLGLACIAGYIWIIISNPFTEIKSDTFEVCIIKHVTDIPCPSCGSTRSVLALLDGRISDAFFWNPIGILLAVFLVIIPAWIIIDLFLKKDTLLKFYKKSEVFLRKREIAIPIIFLVTVNWIWNIFKGL